MWLIILTLLFAGLLAGMIQYFVDYKKLPINGDSENNSQAFGAAEAPSLGQWVLMIFQKLWVFVKQHWHFFAYLIIGTAGAFLLPVVNTFLKLDGIQPIQAYTSCLAAPATPVKPVCSLDNWSVLILFGYGIILGYSAVRIIRGIGFLILGNLSKQQEDLKKSLDATLEKLREQVVKPSQEPPAPPAQDNMMAFEVPLPVTDYFNYHRNEAEKKDYYAGLDLTKTATIFNDLHHLLAGTHHNKLPYRPALHLYPVVDRYKDGLLRSIYSGEAFSLATLIEMDAQVDQNRALALANFLTAHFSPADYADQADRIEADMPYNCEHVVPQSWFSKKDPMKGDLHHLFTCETKCNNFRGNSPYTDFIDYDAEPANLIREDCGKLESQLFEPEINKGVVARAVLYFLIRYPHTFVPGQGYSLTDVPILLKWHNQHKINDYELHRNQQIFRVQGNRNPFIDYPELAGRVDFRHAFSEPDSALQGTAIHPEMETPNNRDDELALEELASLSSWNSCTQNPPPWKNKSWRLANCLKQLLVQVNELAPARRKAHDGTIGDSAHAIRNSDHNPWVLDGGASQGVVTALDITHDPRGKCDCHALAKALQTHKDLRVKYVIWNKRIMNASAINGTPAWEWRPYHGANLHDKHLHISVGCEREKYDLGNQWHIALA